MEMYGDVWRIHRIQTLIQQKMKADFKADGKCLWPNHSIRGSMLQRFKDIFNHTREVFEFLVKGFLLMFLQSMQGLVERGIQVINLPDHHIPTFTQGWTS